MLSKHNIALAASAAFLSKTKAGKCPFGFDDETEQSNLTSTHAHPKVQSSAAYPAEIFTCTAASSGQGIATTTTAASTEANYKAIVSAVIAKYEAVSDVVADNSNPRAKFAGCIVRTVGHDFMDYRVTSGTASGGADGCMAFADADNTGLPTCLTDSGLATTFQDYCETTSLADFLVIAGEAVMGRTSTTYDAGSYYGKATLANVFLQNFQFGRTALETCSASDGLMPNPENGCDGLKSIFVDHIYAAQTGDEWALTAAISGAHTLGSATIANSGYDGFWADSTQSGIFNNDYYKGILFKGWGVERSVNGNSAKNQFKRIDLGSQSLTHKEMMLSTDMCLAMNGGGDPNGPGGDGSDSDDDDDRGGRNNNVTPAPLLAQTHDCCAWMELEEFDIQGGDEFCGGTVNGDGQFSPESANIWNFWDPENRRTCCANEADSATGDCDNRNNANGPAFEAVKEMAESEQAFINGYVRAWNVATTNGFTALTATFGSGNGLAEFNTAIDELHVEQACDYGMFDCDGPTFFECIGNYFGAKRFCSSDGEKGSFRYSYDL